MGKIKLSSSLVAKSGLRNQLVNILQDISNSMKNLIGCNIFNVMVSPDDPNLVFFYEEWLNENSFKSYRSSEIIKKLIDSAKPLMVGFARTKHENIQQSHHIEKLPISH